MSNLSFGSVAMGYKVIEFNLQHINPDARPTGEVISFALTASHLALAANMKQVK
jgi:hypothetical protein